MIKNFALLILLSCMLLPASFASIAPISVDPVAVVIPTNPVTDNGAIKDAYKEFKSLSRHERKERLKDVKNVVKEFKAAKKRGEDPSTNTILLVILAILLPPLAVYLHEGKINTKFWISVLLSLLAFFGLIFYLPAIIYALYVILAGK